MDSLRTSDLELLKRFSKGRDERAFELDPFVPRPQGAQQAGTADDAATGLLGENLDEDHAAHSSLIQLQIE